MSARRSSPRFRRRFSLLAFACALAILAVPAAAFAGTLVVRDIDIASTVHPNGTLELRETRTIDFEGDCTFAFWDLDKTGSAGIEVFGVEGPGGAFQRTDDPQAHDVRPPGTFIVEDAGDTVRVTAFYRLSDTRDTLTVRYRALAAAVRWSDTSELYWQFLPGDRGQEIDHVRIAIDLPEGVSKPDVKAFGHGPLTGVVSIAEDGTVTLEVDDLPGGPFVEARVLFPAGALPAADARSEAMREQILAEELEAAREADAERRAARRQLLLARIAAYGLPLLLLGLGLYVFAKYGREHRPQFVGQYFREDPGDLHPAIVGALWRMGGSSDADFAATLMDMANRGIIVMRPVTTSSRGILGEKQSETYQLTLDRGKLENARKLDKKLVAFLFDAVAGGDSLTIDELKAYAKEHSKTFAEELNDWKSAVKAEVAGRAFFEKRGRNWQAGLAVLGFLSLFVAVGLAINTGALDVGVVGVVLTIPVFVIAAYMQRRSPQAAELHAKYEGLRNYLRDFSRLDEAPPASVVLWNHFLVLAVVFGIAEEVIEAMRVRIPEVVSDPGFATSYWWAYSAGRAGASPVESLQGGFTSAARVAASQNSSSGGGGGFSGGGGGGGGGSSFGGG